jgi:hypothetical protein
VVAGLRVLSSCQFEGRARSLASVHACEGVCMCACMHVCVHACVRACMCACMCVCVHECGRA